LPWCLCGALVFLLALASPCAAQPRVASINIKHIGPQSISDELIRANIRTKVGEAFLHTAVDDDVRNLYAMGLFYNIQVTDKDSPAGVVVTYLVQANPKLKEIKFSGNKKYSDSKLRKKITSKVGSPLDERKLFTDKQEILKLYEKASMPRTQVNYVMNIDEAAGTGIATFDIQESPKVRVIEVDFPGAKAYPEKKLRKVVKTRKHWMFSWLTGSGKLKDEQIEEDRERLMQFYRENGYIDFEIKEINYDHPSPTELIVRFHIFEGVQYKVGSVKFSGNQTFTTQQLTNGFPRAQAMRDGKVKRGANGLPMDVGDTFTPKGLTRDVETVEDFYGARGYVDVSSFGRNLVVEKIPNTETGTMDLEFKITEGQKYTIEKIDIRGNTKTKDRVIRRELAVSPGEVFDTVRVKLSKQRLQNTRFFEKVDTRPESTDLTGKKNLAITVDERQTGNVSLGAGFSSVDSLVGFVEYNESNFDLKKLIGMEPWFQGAGQKFRLRLQIGTERQDYLISFAEPWFTGRKLRLGTELYRHDWRFQSENDLYDEVRTGGRVSLTKALGSDFLIGSVSYTLENVEIIPTAAPALIPQAIQDEEGYSLISKVGFSLAYDTRNGVQLPNKGQRTEIVTEVAGLGGDKEFYTVQLKSSWYFKGFLPGHVLEVTGRTGIGDSFGSTTNIPFYERFYLGGLYSLRGYKYRTISPREDPNPEPIGGDTMWFGSLEYSIPIVSQVRLAVFYDIGDVQLDPFTYRFKDYTDNWGIGMRLNLPIGPLRFDYGVPIHYDPRYQDGHGQFQFGVGYTREF
jgi:outer membrane protein insertion porin family